MAVQTVKGLCRIYGDCIAVTNAAVAPGRLQLDLRTPYAGIHRAIGGYDGRRYVELVEWVRAHSMDNATDDQLPAS